MNQFVQVKMKMLNKIMAFTLYAIYVCAKGKKPQALLIKVFIVWCTQFHSPLMYFPGVQCYPIKPWLVAFKIVEDILITRHLS